MPAVNRKINNPDNPYKIFLLWRSEKFQGGIVMTEYYQATGNDCQPSGPAHACRKQGEGQKQAQPCSIPEDSDVFFGGGCGL